MKTKDISLLVIIFWMNISLIHASSLPLDSKVITKRYYRIETLWPDTTAGLEFMDSAIIKTFYQHFPQFNPVKKKVLQFYAERGERLAWTNNGRPIPHTNIFVNMLENLQEHGLQAYDTDRYNLSDTLSVVSGSRHKKDSSSSALRMSFDITLTSLYFKYAPTLWQGSVNPHADDRIQWFVDREKIPYSKMLDSLLAESESINPFIDYRQFNPQYLKLKEQLKWYAAEKSMFSHLRLNKTYLSRGDSSIQVGQISERLSSFGDLNEQDISNEFNSKLERAVKHFQFRHGLKVDGVVGENTLKAMNVSMDDRMKQIMINMERWRWIPRGMSGDYLYVNIPQFELSVYEDDKKVDQIKIIVGKEGAKTVTFNDRVKYVVINPFWNIPRSITIDEILPKIKENKNYLNKANIEVGIKWKFGMIDQDTINWKNVNESNFNYTLRQKPGPDNPLGKIKFIFPNDFAIYLHDTPMTKLFDERQRGFSHGCIRVDNPVYLADRLLDKESYADILKLLEEKQNKWITLSNSIPIYILYNTAWVDDMDQLHFREDIYGHDADLASVLFSAP